MYCLTLSAKGAEPLYGVLGVSMCVPLSPLGFHTLTRWSFGHAGTIPLRPKHMQQQLGQNCNNKSYKSPVSRPPQMNLMDSQTNWEATGSQDDLAAPKLPECNKTLPGFLEPLSESLLALPYPQTCAFKEMLSYNTFEEFIEWPEDEHVEGQPEDVAACTSSLLNMTECPTPAQNELSGSSLQYGQLSVLSHEHHVIDTSFDQKHQIVYKSKGFAQWTAGHPAGGYLDISRSIACSEDSTIRPDAQGSYSYLTDSGDKEVTRIMAYSANAAVEKQSQGFQNVPSSIAHTAHHKTATNQRPGSYPELVQTEKTGVQIRKRRQRAAGKGPGSWARISEEGPVDGVTNSLVKLRQTQKTSSNYIYLSSSRFGSKSCAHCHKYRQHCRYPALPTGILDETTQCETCSQKGMTCVPWKTEEGEAVWDPDDA